MLSAPEAELTRVASLVQLLPHDSLLVFDRAPNRVTVFAPPPHEVAYVTNLAQASGLSIPARVERLPKNRAMLGIYTPSFRAGEDARGDTARSQIVRLLRPNGTILRDSVLKLPASEMLVLRSPGFVSVEPSPPMGRRAILRAGPEERLYYNWTDSATVDVFDLYGQRMDTFAIPAERLATTAEEIEAAAEELGDEFGAVFRRSAPASWPLISNLLIDDRGRLWIGSSGRPGAPREWLILDRSGKLPGVRALGG